MHPIHWSVRCFLPVAPLLKFGVELTQAGAEVSEFEFECAGVSTENSIAMSLVTRLTSICHMCLSWLPRPRALSKDQVACIQAIQQVILDLFLISFHHSIRPVADTLAGPSFPCRADQGQIRQLPCLVVFVLLVYDFSCGPFVYVNCGSLAIYRLLPVSCPLCSAPDLIGPFLISVLPRLGGV